MPYSSRTQEQLLEEITVLKDRIRELESLVSEIRTLRDNDQMFRSFMDNNPAIAWMKDDRGRYVYLNRTYEQRFGVAQRDWIGKTDHEVWPREVADVFSKNDTSVLQQLISEEIFEDTIDHQGRRNTWFNIKFPFSDTHGNRFVAGMGIDVTRRKLAEEALRESENKFMTAFMNSPVAMCIVCAENEKYVEVNDVFVRDSGYSREEIIGSFTQELGLFAETSDRDRLLRMVRQNGHAYGEEMKFRMKSGKEIVCSISANLIYIGGKPHFLSSILDVNRVKETIKALAESEERFRLAIKTTPDSICITRLDDGFIVEINDAFTKMRGYSRKDVLNRRAVQVGLWHDPADRRKMADLLMRNGHLIEHESLFRRRDGSLFRGSISANIVSFKGEPFIISVTRDLTDLIESEREKRELQERLFQSQKIESLGTLVGGIAHDFNNMLQIIIGYAEILMDGDSVKRDCHDQLGTIIRTSRDGADLVAKLLAFGQQARGFPIPIDLNSELQSMAPFIARTMPVQVELSLDLMEARALINADRTQVDQVIMNLAINAAEAMPNGGFLKITTRKVYLDDEYCRNRPGTTTGEHIQLKFSDNGSGINPNDLSRIFDPFFSTKQKGSTRGTGMGLSVVMGIVQQYGGHITCDSEQGKGSEFTIYFPAIQTVGQAVPVSDRSPRSGETQTILLVEDVPLIAEMEKSVLETEGFDVLVASNGKEALDIYRKHGKDISLVALDLVMPVMSGKECLMKLMKIDPLVKILVISGHSPNDELSRELIPHVKGFVSKPCVRNDLILAIRSALSD